MHVTYWIQQNLVSKTNLPISNKVFLKNLNINENNIKRKLSVALAIIYIKAAKSINNIGAQ